MKFHFPLVLLSLALAMPAQAEKTMQELEYKSAFEGYKNYSDPEIQNWPDMIKRVEEIGGWRVYAREPYEEKDKTKEPPKANPAAYPDPAKSNANNHGGAQ